MKKEPPDFKKLNTCQYCTHVRVRYCALGNKYFTCENYPDFDDIDVIRHVQNFKHINKNRRGTWEMNKKHAIKRFNKESAYYDAIHNQCDMICSVFKSFDGEPLINLRKKSSYKSSHRIGLLHVSFDNVIKLFGLPHMVSTTIGSKKGLQWIFKCDKSFIVIYDYCVNLLYDKNGISFKDNNTWSIGSDNSEVLDKIEELIKDYEFVRLEK